MNDLTEAFNTKAGLPAYQIQYTDTILKSRNLINLFAPLEFPE